jgi:hypothetical protein
MGSLRSFTFLGRRACCSILSECAGYGAIRNSRLANPEDCGCDELRLATVEG